MSQKIVRLIGRKFNTTIASKYVLTGVQKTDSLFLLMKMEVDEMR